MFLFEIKILYYYKFIKIKILNRLHNKFKNINLYYIFIFIIL